MRILTRYILGEILSHAFIGCALFTFILFMRELPNILLMVVRNSSTLRHVAEAFLFALPNFFIVTIPMGVLVGVLLGLSRLAADSEIVAMRASGLGIGYFVKVASIVAAGATLIGLFNSIYVAPRANQGILDLDRLLASQATYEIQPRVFYEDFKDKVLYVQNVISGTGAANWRQLFMADVTDPAAPRITTAASATVINDSTTQLLMRLRDGTEHEQPEPGQPTQYNISTFSVDDLPFTPAQQNEGHLGRLDTPLYALPLHELLRLSRGPDGKRFLIEAHKRFSYPAACLVLMLVGVPLGVTSRRGGKSSAWVFTILLVCLYYSLSLFGTALGKQDWISAPAAVWLANILFAAGGMFLLWQMASGGRVLAAIASLASRPPKPAEEKAEKPGSARRALTARFFPSLQRNAARHAFPRILDEYVVREFLFMFFLVLCGFVLLMLVFTFFELIGDILRNHISLAIVGQYLINLTPSMIYTIAPLAMLIAVLVTFGVLNRNSEIVAMKATGISLYRMAAPIAGIAAMLAVSLFLFDDLYLPQANRRQEALRNIIKGRPAQTVLHPEQRWIFGAPRPGEPGRIFYYRFFDSAHQEFADLSVFEFDPATFAIVRRIFASRVYWDPARGVWNFENGWQRDIQGENSTAYREFAQAAFTEIHEDPGYFTKEEKQSQEMSFAELARYIAGLRQSGLDTIRLRVALWHKLAYPLVGIVMAAIAIPFALSMGKRGSLTGIAVAIGIALAYWVADSLFSALGSVDYLPAPLAACASLVLFGLAGGYLLLRTPT